MNRIFIATSMDGYIADKNGNIHWLLSIANPDNDDMGYNEFMAIVDGIVMGRVTYETVLGFGIEWPYTKPVFVLSNTLKEIPEQLKEKVEIINGTVNKIIDNLTERGYNSLYIDGGKTIQYFLEADKIDEMIITIIPLLLGGGIPLFAVMSQSLQFECTHTKMFLDSIVQNRFVRKRIVE